MKRVPMTVSGAEKLREELRQLKQVERPSVIDAIAIARAHGDLKENAEYHAAREQQSFIEGRIKEIGHKLSLAEIIDVTKLHQDGRIVFGVTVDLLDEESGEEQHYQIVGDEESDIKQRRLSINSPMARAMIGKSAGDQVVVRAPGGEIRYEVLEVHYR